MAGHSKWANIKYKKGATDAKRAKIFSKIAKEITVAVKMGGEVLENNSRLRLCIATARAANMPNDNINRAIKKATGELSDALYEELTYEGYAPQGVAIVVDCLSDNRNRSASDIRNLFNKNHGNLGTPGSVAWIFHRKCQFIIEDEKTSEDQLLELTLDIDIEDIIDNGANTFEILAPIETFEDIQKVLEQANLNITTAQLTKIPENTVNIKDEATAQKIMRLIDVLEEHDDVQKVYTNFSVDEKILQKLME